MTSRRDNIISAEGLHKSFGRGRARVHVLRGLDLAVRRGEFVAVMGPSGCGKSTLLHVLGFMTAPDAGRIVLNGRAVSTRPAEMNRLRRRHVGFIFQRFNLLGQLTAADNVAISLRVRGLRADGRADALFETLGIAHVAARKPGEMSIGEQQRVAVVRALAHRPALLLADEPTGSLDSANSAALLEELRKINRRDGQTIIMITHSAEAAAAADRVVHMKDGKIIERTG
ncbi:MAG: ABC transporter ATP-binding protein [Planctomycetes bacterium]|nr:ABC transporter ATP-binding protein [Planctomycetota bacterium]